MPYDSPYTPITSDGRMSLTLKRKSLDQDSQDEQQNKYQSGCSTSRNERLNDQRGASQGRKDNKRPIKQKQDQDKTDNSPDCIKYPEQKSVVEPQHIGKRREYESPGQKTRHADGKRFDENCQLSKKDA